MTMSRSVSCQIKPNTHAPEHDVSTLHIVVSWRTKLLTRTNFGPPTSPFISHVVYRSRHTALASIEALAFGNTPITGLLLVASCGGSYSSSRGMSITRLGQTACFPRRSIPRLPVAGPSVILRQSCDLLASGDLRSDFGINPDAYFKREISLLL